MLIMSKNIDRLVGTHNLAEFMNKGIIRNGTRITRSTLSGIRPVHGLSESCNKCLPIRKSSNTLGIGSAYTECSQQSDGSLTKWTWSIRDDLFELLHADSEKMMINGLWVTIYLGKEKFK
ncbi:lipase [Phtheirospermum japonicum]|uniref:Lipase n=1 Tax=Phtheirospermum japonicum TaxID=374723 RepID=A0A830C9N7_9LAMI|nr:lipase [Phtheirospermum japonicum]